MNENMIPKNIAFAGRCMGCTRAWTWWPDMGGPVLTGEAPHPTTKAPTPVMIILCRKCQPLAEAVSAAGLYLHNEHFREAIDELTDDANFGPGGVDYGPDASERVIEIYRRIAGAKTKAAV